VIATKIQSFQYYPNLSGNCKITVAINSTVPYRNIWYNVNTAQKILWRTWMAWLRKHFTKYYMSQKLSIS